MAINTDPKKGIPGVPLAALNAIQDENARTVLQAIVDGWHVRNGQTGGGDSRFITKGEISGPNGFMLIGGAGGVWGSTGNKSGNNGLTANQIAKIINDLQASIDESPLWKDLGTRITLIDKAVILEQRDRVIAVQKLAEDLAGEAATRLGFDSIFGSRVDSIEEETVSSALSIHGLTTRMEGSESTIILLQQTSSNQATTLESLMVSTGQNSSSIIELNKVTSTSATQLDSVTTRIGETESNVSTLKVTSEGVANSLNVVSAQVGKLESDAVAVITQEVIARTNSDNALASAVNTIWASIGDNQALVQNGASGIVNNAGAAANQWNQLDAAVRNPIYNPNDPYSQKYLSSASIRQDASVSLERTGDIYAKYTVKMDINGYVAGFGLMSTASNDYTPVSEFIVRADRFSIGNPNAPRPIVGYNPDGSPKYGDPPPNSRPFIVLTNTDGRGTPPGVYITDASIQNAAIGTLKINGEAVTQTRYTQSGGNTTLNTWFTIFCTLNVTIPTEAGSASVVITGNASAYPTNDDMASFVLGVGTSMSGVIAETGVTITSGGVLNMVVVGTTFPPGNHTIYLGARTQAGIGASTKQVGYVCNLVMQGQYR